MPLKISLKGKVQFKNHNDDFDEKIWHYKVNPYTLVMEHV